MNIHSIDTLYEGKRVEERDGQWICPVCSKVYKQKKSAENHLRKQNCHSVVDVFGDTEYEQKAFMFFKNLQANKGKGYRPTIKSFRKSRLYKGVVMYVVSCIANDVDQGLMYSFLNEIVGFSHDNAILSNGQDMKWVKAYRSFVHNHPEISDSKEYYEQYGDVLIEEPDFLIQSIEKAKISAGWIEKKPKLLRAVEDLPIGYRMRLMDILKEAEESGW